MLKLLTSHLTRNINVYEGISPSLLATMSLSVDIKGKTHKQLIDSLKNGQMVASPQEYDAWLSVDRQFFTSATGVYMNKPCAISKGQNMTDIFTHAVMVNSLGPYWRNKMRILDVGTGHGYLSFLIARILRNKKLEGEVIGIDIHEEAINRCRQIKSQHFGGQKMVNFQCGDLGQYLRENQTKFDVIIGGYFIDEMMSDKLVGRLEDGGVGIWPTRSDHGQALYKLQPNKEKVYLMQTLFSMPVVRSNVSRYFIEEDQKEEEGKIEKQEQSKKEVKMQERMKLRKEREEELRGQLKVLLEKNRKQTGKIMSLKQMKQIPEISQKLQQLQALPKTKLKQK